MLSSFQNCHMWDWMEIQRFRSFDRIAWTTNETLLLLLEDHQEKVTRLDRPIGWLQNAIQVVESLFWIFPRSPTDLTFMLAATWLVSVNIRHGR
jgi:hypothetical protein